MSKVRTQTYDRFHPQCLIELRTQIQATAKIMDFHSSISEKNKITCNIDKCSNLEEKPNQMNRIESAEDCNPQIYTSFYNAAISKIKMKPR